MIYGFLLKCYHTTRIRHTDEDDDDRITRMTAIKSVTKMGSMIKMGMSMLMKMGLSMMNIIGNRDDYDWDKFG